jgi:hypothetical protein
MELKTKKRIAKEILLFLSSVLFSLIIYLLVYPFNWYCSSKSEGIQNLVNSKTLQADSLAFRYNWKLGQQRWFYDVNLKEYDVTALGYNSYVDLWNRLEVVYSVDSIDYKYSNVWDRTVIEMLHKNGFHNAQAFKEFIAKNLLTESDKQDKLKSDDVKSEIAKLNSDKRTWELKALTCDEQMWFSLKAFVVVLIFVYPFRFLLWLTVWSFRTLNQKSD